MRALRLVERNLVNYRRRWPQLASGFLEPVLYLFSLGVGLGHFVGSVDGTGYADFVAPAMLAASAMNGAVVDTTFGVFFRLRYSRFYAALVATPLGPGDIALGETLWSVLRGTVYGAVFLAVMAAAGYVHSWWALAALPAIVLLGCTFAALGLAATTFLRSWQDIDLLELVLLFLFLFSGTFSPASAYPAGVRWLVQLSPLYHGVALIRQLTLGRPGPSIAVHLAVLAAVGLVAGRIAARRLHRRLLR